jgi:hypothetical protein
MATTPTSPQGSGILDLLRQGGRWWMWIALGATGLAVVALVASQALEYVAPYFYVAL